MTEFQWEIFYAATLDWWQAKANGEKMEADKRGRLAMGCNDLEGLPKMLYLIQILDKTKQNLEKFCKYLSKNNRDLRVLIFKWVGPI